MSEEPITVQELAFKIQEIVLERKKFGAMRVFDGEVMYHVCATHVVEPFLNQFVLSIRRDIMGRTIERVCVKYPRDWKEAVKERFAPKWFLARRPVRYRERVVEVMELCPDIPIPPGATTVLRYVSDATRDEDWTK